MAEDSQDTPPDVEAKRAALPAEPTRENATTVAYGGSREDPEAYTIVPDHADTGELTDEFCGCWTVPRGNCGDRCRFCRRRRSPSTSGTTRRQRTPTNCSRWRGYRRASESQRD